MSAIDQQLRSGHGGAGLLVETVVCLCLKRPYCGALLEVDCGDGAMCLPRDRHIDAVALDASISMNSPLKPTLVAATHFAPPQ